MAPLITLIVTFAIARAWIGARGQQDPGARAGRAALAVMLFVTGTAHFVSTEAMVQMLPSFVPGATMIVYATGVLELAVGGWLLRNVARPTPWLGWALAGFFVAPRCGALHDLALAPRGAGTRGREQAARPPHDASAAPETRGAARAGRK